MCQTRRVTRSQSRINGVDNNTQNNRKTYRVKRKNNQIDTNGHDTQHDGKVNWRQYQDPSTGRLITCRKPGSPAGSFPLTPWWHCVFHDPYERINFWSHSIPALCFFILSLHAYYNLHEGVPLALFSACATVTHALSSLTHVFPDSHALEKCDHFGIVCTIIGTPASALAAQAHGHLPTPFILVSIYLLVAALMKPVPRVIGFISGGGAFVILYGKQLIDVLFFYECLLYNAGALFFLRNDGHNRVAGFSDHHLLHYFVTLASMLHVKYLLKYIF